MYLPMRRPILLTHIKVNIILEGSDLGFLGIYSKKQKVFKGTFFLLFIIIKLYLIH